MMDEPSAGRCASAVSCWIRCADPVSRRARLHVSARGCVLSFLDAFDILGFCIKHRSCPAREFSAIPGTVRLKAQYRSAPVGLLASSEPAVSMQDSTYIAPAQHFPAGVWI